MSTTILLKGNSLIFVYLLLIDLLFVYYFLIEDAHVKLICYALALFVTIFWFGSWFIGVVAWVVLVGYQYFRLNFVHPRGIVQKVFLNQVTTLLILFLISLFLGHLNEYGTRLTELLRMSLDIEGFNQFPVLMVLVSVNAKPVAGFIQRIMHINALELDLDPISARSGYLIGMLERMILILLGMNSRFESIGIILAIKSLARFKQLEDRIFAERYLVGTLLSLMIAIISIELGLWFQKFS